MLKIHKSYVLDEKQTAIAVKIPITEFEQIEEILENHGLAELIDEVKEEKTLSKSEALTYLNTLQK